MDRRTFLKLAGMGSIAFAGGCTSDSDKTLFAQIQADNDMTPGEATWYASVCRECPAGCGVIAKNREGRVIKLEGNPLHPVNRGKLCMRGQAALQGIYHPDRLNTPLLQKDGSWQPIGFEKAVTLIKEAFAGSTKKDTGRIGMLTETTGSSLNALFKDTLNKWESDAPLTFEPFAYESLKYAHSLIFGSPVLPSYHMDQADLIIGFGADFLETWLSPVEYAVKFKSMHAVKDRQKSTFVQVSPFQSLTCANADFWLPCPAGHEAMIALFLIKNVLEKRSGGLPRSFKKALISQTEGLTVETVAGKTGIDASDLIALTKRLLSSKKPLVLGTGSASTGDSAVAVDLAATLLNVMLDEDLSLYDFNNRHHVETANKRSEVLHFFESIKNGKMDVLLLHNTNPAATLPHDSGVLEALQQKEMFTVSFSNFMDETARLSDLVIPFQLPLETWDTYEGKTGMTATLQPAMGKWTKHPSMGDLFIKLANNGAFAPDYKTHVKDKLASDNSMKGPLDLIKAFQRGGVFSGDGERFDIDMAMDHNILDILRKDLEALDTMDKDRKTFMAVPSIRYFDGRGAGKPWLNEIPDSVTQVAWQTTAMVHPDTMSDLGLKEGRVASLSTDAGTLEVPVYEYPGVHINTVAVAMGYGHDTVGRYSRGNGKNPLALLKAATVADAGCPIYMADLKTAKDTGKTIKLASTSGSKTMHGRKIAASISLKTLADPHPKHHKEGLAMDNFPLTLPIREGYDPKRDFYPPHEHNTYRWGMVVDLDRCIGCNACAAACYAENNVGIVGEEQIIEGREMAWLRIERYHDPIQPWKISFIPMMCQHCDNAPCESVCPVYAPHHSKEGLNNQVYNRCIGTRFCAQNCPYKVRRFNWFDWDRPHPMNLQFNPNVTVRGKGVMEKCSFCVQRIKEARQTAKNESRNIKDQEVIPACAQTCPTNAITFGNFLDPSSRISKLAKDARAYQAMGYLNTKPAVIYLKKVVQKDMEKV